MKSQREEWIKELETARESKDAPPILKTADFTQLHDDDLEALVWFLRERHSDVNVDVE